MIKSFARPEKETPKLASGAKVLMLGLGLINHLTLPSQLKEVDMLDLPIPPHPRVQILIVNSATWIWDDHGNTATVAVDPIPIIHMDRLDLTTVL